MQFLHESIYQNVLDQLVGVYKQVKVGDPLEKGTLVGPLHTQVSRENFVKGISTIKSQASIGYFVNTLKSICLVFLFDSSVLHKVALGIYFGSNVNANKYLFSTCILLV